MKFFTQHWEKLLLALSVLVICAWGVVLYRQVIVLSEEVVEQHGAGERATGRPLAELTEDDFTAPTLLEPDRAQWRTVEREGRASMVRPQAIVACVNEDCQYWMPFGQTRCPFCGEEQGDVVAEPVDPEPEEVPLARRLFVAEVSREPFGATLRRITVIPGRPKESWDLQIDVIERDGRRVTRFARLGGTIGVEGREYEIVGVERKEEVVFYPSIGADQVNDVSEVTLRGPDEQEVVLVRSRQVFVGPYQIRLILIDPEGRYQHRTFAVSSDQVLEIRDFDGAIRRFDIVEVSDEERVLSIRPAGQPEREVIRIGPPPRERTRETGPTRGMPPADRRAFDPGQMPPRFPSDY